MAIGDDRWVEVSPSQFPWEREGLAIVRALLPAEAPFRAWSNFEFRDSQGRWHEVDLLVLTRDTLHLVELKYYTGVLRGDDYRWLRSGHRAEDSPLRLARRKAQYFASKLKTELDIWAREVGTKVPDPRQIVPFVQESVFLHHENLRCELSDSSKIGLYGLDRSRSSGLPGISELLLAPSHHKPIGPNQEEILAKLIARLGLVQRRERVAGSWVIEDSSAVDEGEGWQEWLASHRVAQQEKARIRFQVLPADAPESDRARVRKIADHEYRTMSRLHHDGLVCPRDMVESDLGVGLVYDHDDHWQRLDLWMADANGQLPLGTQLSVVRQVAEALNYAHSNKVVHRSLNPRAVWVRERLDSDDVKVRVSDWHGSGLVDGAETTSATPGVTSLLGAQRHTSTYGSSDDTADQWSAAPFQAPEGAWNPSADRVRLDIFGLGALAFYVLTGRSPASSAVGLRDRIRDQDGLDMSVELPQVSNELRDAILNATRPAPTDRVGDVHTFLKELASAERSAANANDTPEDPLDATPGTLLDGRFDLQRRLGKGSTAVGLLVKDLTAPDNATERVLKVAINDEAASRLNDEADVLRGLRSARLVRLLEGPLMIGNRRALLLESAGDETLTEALRQRGRLSIDLLQRYGEDLLDAVVALDKAGVDHRDIKPSNLGIRESRGDRTKHLVLFDFSLTRAAASATSAGTPPYLDPFLGSRDRPHFDSAAERYSAAVVLFEMSTGHTPRYGDGEADPSVITDEATIRPKMFDRSLAKPLTAFFTAALARDVTRRHHTAAEMRAQWLAIFADESTTEADDSADARAAAATLATPLLESGLSPRALSALEPLALSTVGELLTVDSVSISRMPGVRNSTRIQITRRMKAWRERLGKPPKSATRTDSMTAEDAAQRLLEAVTVSGVQTRGGLLRLILGHGTEVSAFATNAQFAAHLSVSPGRVSQLLAELQHAWASDQAALEVLDPLADELLGVLPLRGGVMTYVEAVQLVHTSLDSVEPRDGRLETGLLRCALERIRARRQADGDDQLAITSRRRDGQVTLLATDPALLDVAEALGHVADELVTTGSPETTLVRGNRALPRLRPVVSDLPDDLRTDALTSDDRLLRLATSASTQAACAGAGDLHHRNLSISTAVRLTFQGFASAELKPDDVRRRVRVAFPAVGELPRRPQLDQLLHDAGLSLTFDDVRGAYRVRVETAETTGLESRRATTVAVTVDTPESLTEADRRMAQSIRSRSFLAIGIPASILPKTVATLEHRYAATVVDVTGVLLQALRAESERIGLPWDMVLAADAAEPTSRDRQGLAALVSRSWPLVQAAVDDAVATAQNGPVLITEAAPLTRYGNIAMLTRWTELAARRQRPVWLAVPQLGSSRGAMLDGRPLPLDSPSQFVRVDQEWVDTVMSPVGATAAKES